MSETKINAGLSSQSRHSTTERIVVRRYPTETPLALLVIVTSLASWLLLALSFIGLIYVVFIALFLFFSHLSFVSYLRGSAVRVGPEQFPELHQRCQDLAHRAGLKKIPEVYILQAGGVLNALAAKFFRANFLVLFSDLLEACQENEHARDMIIGHELGHIKEGHLRWFWLKAPAMFMPFLGHAYSRAREFTADRYGVALCGNSDGAVFGMTILAAGGKLGKDVNPGSFVQQSRSLNTGWMTLGK